MDPLMHSQSPFNRRRQTVAIESSLSQGQQPTPMAFLTPKMGLRSRKANLSASVIAPSTNNLSAVYSPPKFGERRYLRRRELDKIDAIGTPATHHQQKQKPESTGFSLSRKPTNESMIKLDQKGNANKADAGTTYKDSNRVTDFLLGAKKSPVVIRRLSRKMNWISKQLSR